MDSERERSLPGRLRESGMIINNRDSVEAGIDPDGGIGRIVIRPGLIRVAD